MSGQGQQIFIDALTRFVAHTGDPELVASIGVLTRELAVPLRIEVRGRRGVGTSTVAAALSAAGYRVVAARPELVVRVLAEVCKPEDRDALREDPPDLLLLNKADLAGWGAGGPLPKARRQAAALSASTGIPTRAFVAPLALVAGNGALLDDRMVATLRTLIAEPADLTCADAFVHGPHRLPSAQRRRLIETLDLFGVAHAVVTLRDNPTAGADELRLALGAVSGIGEVDEAIARAGSAARYRRIAAVCDALAARAVTDTAIAEFLADDATVLARMTAAVDVVRAAGLAVDSTDDPAAHLDRALAWRAYADGPVSAIQRSCGADIVRGSLRLLHAGRPA